MTVGEKIRYIRLFRNLTQRELASVLGFVKSSMESRISQIEKGVRNPRSNLIKKISEVLDVPVFVLQDHIDDRVTNIIMNMFWNEIEMREYISNNSAPNSENTIITENNTIRNIVQFHMDNHKFGDDETTKKLSVFQEYRQLMSAGIISFEDYIHVMLNWDTCSEIKEERNKMIFGDRLRFIRNYREMTQKELGIALGISVKNAAKRIHQYEKNEKIPRDDVIKKMAEILKISESALKRNYENKVIEFVEDFMWLENSFNTIEQIYSPFFHAVEINKKPFYIELTKQQELIFKLLSELKEKQDGLKDREIYRPCTHAYLVEYIKASPPSDYIEFKLQWPENSMYYEEIINYKK